MFFDNPSPEIRRFLTGLIYCAMLNVYKIERKNLNSILDPKSSKKSVLSNFINIVLTNLKYSRLFTEYYESFHQIIA